MRILFVLTGAKHQAREACTWVLKAAGATRTAAGEYHISMEMAFTENY